mmetsp:Transcript_50580/g.141658  ORF Transcript_50580/g.141658 Transcript_50580/m.141658 type:complete len:216 (+) Transcript_50580:85-732(+)
MAEEAVDGGHDLSGVRWGPKPKSQPNRGSSMSVNERRQAVVECALAYVGKLKYAHHHTPAAGGLDCSNFTRWVYKKALGDAFDFETSHVQRQSELGDEVTMVDPEYGPQTFIGQKKPLQELVDGDLLFFTNKRGGDVCHTGIFATKHSPDGRPCLIHSSEAAARRVGIEPGVMITPIDENELHEWPLKNGPHQLGPGASGGVAIRHPALCRSCEY